MEKVDDVQLIHDILSGDDEAFNTLVKKYQKSVHALAWRKVGDFHYAEEITQDTFLQVYKNLSRLRNPNLFTGWLYVIANRLCLGWLQKQKDIMQSLEELPVKEIDRLTYERYIAEQRESEAIGRRYAIVKKLLKKLPESERTVVTLYYLGEMPVKEIGKFLGVSVNTIRSRLHRARKRLQGEEQLLVQEVLGGVQISENLIHNIMGQVANLKPIPPSPTKPSLPWLALGTAVTLIIILLGASNQYLVHFQHPYSFKAQSEHTIKIIDAPVVLDIDSKPDVRNQTGRDTPASQNGNAGSQTSETLLISTTGENSVTPEKNIELCSQNLVAIGKAIQSYKKENNDYPEWLSDLYPKYLADANILICPADTDEGKALFTPNVDPKMPVSYGYQFYPEYREKKSEQRLVYGEVMPLVRCRHHANEDFYALNLSFSYMIYRSPKDWEYAPKDMYGSPEAAITAFEETLEQHPDDERFHVLYPLLVNLYIEVENERAVDELIERFKLIIKPNIDIYRTLYHMLVWTERYEDMLEIFKVAEQQHPDAQLILARLASIYRKLGNIELAEAYERKFDPIYELFGKPVPDFSATDLDGESISLRDYHGNIILLDFWDTWCGFSLVEMPNIKRVYDTYKDEGFDIIGVNLDDEEAILQDYIKENDIPCRQIFDTAAGEHSLLQQYGITGVPELWLIDREGKLITHKARWENLDRLVAEAMKDKSTN